MWPFCEPYHVDAQVEECELKCVASIWVPMLLLVKEIMPRIMHPTGKASLEYYQQRKANEGIDLDD